MTINEGVTAEDVRPSAYVDHLLDLVVNGPFNETVQIRNNYRKAAAYCLLDAREAENLAEGLTTVVLREGELRAERLERG